MARRRPSTVLPVLSRTTGCPVKRKARSGLPPGVSKTISGKFQARIKLHGKRYDLGTFMNEDDAAAAYKAAKAAGVAATPGGRARLLTALCEAQARLARPTPAPRTECNC